MNGYRLLTIIVVSAIAVGTTGYLWAQSTSQDADDISGAREAMRRLMEQGPPVTPLKATDADAKPRQTAETPSRQPGRGLGLRGGADSSSSASRLLPEGHFIIDRRGRLTSTDDYAVFTFDSDGKALMDPPIRILPNRWLEKMETDVANSHDSIIFRVSGEITSYRGNNYLLLRKVLIERSLDNIR